jgi:hypothetical protein
LIGENTLRTYAREIARFLNLPNIDEYTSHSFRVSGATAIVNSGGSMLELKSAGGWKSDKSAGQYFQISDLTAHNNAKKLRLDDDQLNYSLSNNNSNSSHSNSVGYKTMHYTFDLKNARNCNVTIGLPQLFDDTPKKSDNSNNNEY